ncbi:diguanylate cyclase domain-containing protein [Niallia endozanthoxylica]|uniref:Diguanylate cyclase n=1 Tax=Niallia endozanthoxylica TaxID=2036016 RepID=A0A5J5I8D5_9BACI|nr:diguanylate cyclase [Niallia endozanthoxylica]KAA9031168.1 diguanylate cyclase [Niallia endozanthoxylica]
MLFSNIFNRLGIVSLKGRLKSWFLCFIALMVLMASIPFVFLGKQQKREDANVTIEKTIQLQQVVINNWFEEQMANIQALSELPIVKAFDLELMAKSLESFDQSHSEFNGVVYINEEGMTEIDTSGPTGIDLSDREYFKQAKKGKSFVTDVLIGRQSHSQIIIFSNPIYDSNGSFRGLIFGAVPLVTINNVMNQFHDESSETYLVDRNGMLITESRQGEIGEYISTKIYKEAIAGKPITHLYETKNGERVLGNYRWVHNNQWLIIGEIIESKIYEPFYHMAFMFSIVVLLGSLIGYILLILVSTQIESPIRKVLEGTRRIGERNFNYRLDKHVYEKEAIEFQELCDNFNQMNEIIENYIVTLEKSEERFRMIAEYSTDMITIHDSSGKYLYVSPAGKEILQYEDNEVIGYDGYLFIHPDDLEMIRGNHEILLKNGYVVSTYRIRRKDGVYIWFESSFKCLEGKKPDEPQLIGISRNITERKLVEQTLEETNRVLQELSTKDGLTGVWNRRTFDERLEMEWSFGLRNSAALSLIMLDIDYFKKFNDTYGHQAGDDCLIKVANAIDVTAKKTRGMVFRYGGEEFGVILPETERAEAELTAEMIRKAVESQNILHSGSAVSQYVTVSLGVNTIIPNEEQTIDQFIVEADKALYQAKQKGRNCSNSFIEQ